MEVLGLEGPAAPVELKRAYHRRLRVTKPDEDSEGFKRLREAYELLQQAGEAPKAASGAEGASEGASEGAGRQVELHVLGAPLDGMAEEVDLQEHIRQLDRAVRFSPERLELWVALVTALVQSRLGRRRWPRSSAWRATTRSRPGGCGCRSSRSPSRRAC